MNCTTSCGFCHERSQCNSFDGSCPEGCQEGYNFSADPKCSISKCKRILFLLITVESNSLLVLWGKLYVICLWLCSWCVFYEQNIFLFFAECDAGYFGKECALKCGHCMFSPCDHISGFCHQNCQPGYNFSNDPLCINGTCFVSIKLFLQ